MPSHDENKPQGEQFRDLPVMRSIDPKELEELWKKEEEEWDFPKTDEDIVKKYGPETLELVKKVVERQLERQALWKKRERTPWGRLQNKRTERREIQAAVNWILHGLGHEEPMAECMIPEGTRPTGHPEE